MNREYERKINLLKLLENKSFFLFGPRATGKTYLIRKQLEGKIQVIDLLRSDMLLRLSENPTELESFIHQPVVAIDEVQKIPSLLNEVHRLIEEKNIRFLLTGSSARKLKREHADMLAGRAWIARLFPLVSAEIPDFTLDRYLRYGGLPAVCASNHPEEELDAYVQTYLKEEIMYEGLIRKLPPFSRFLKSSALSNGKLLNFTQIGEDAQISPSTVREYYSVLEDTLLGWMLEPWTHSKKRKAVQTAKFYFFDPGVTHTIAGTRVLERNSDLYGQSFEQFIGMELKAYLSYHRINDSIAFWRSHAGYEVDFVIGDHTAIEVKATAHLTSHDIKGLNALAEEHQLKHFYVVSHDRMETRKDNIIALHWKSFLSLLWNGQLIGR